VELWINHKLDNPAPSVASVIACESQELGLHQSGFAGRFIVACRPALASRIRISTCHCQ